MHTSLVIITYGTIILLGSFIFVTALGLEPNTKTHYWRLLWLIPLLGILFVFAKTSGFPNPNEITKTSTEKWHTVYENNINADVTVTTDHIILNPKKPFTKEDKENLFSAHELIPFNPSSNTVTITATNKNDSTSKEATLTDDNFIEKWPKGTNPDKSKGRIIKIEYRHTPIALKWFGMAVEKTSYDEARITIEYDATKDPSTKQLFGED